MARISDAVKKLITNTFEDSSRRLNERNSSSNDYIFLENQFSIECHLKYVQNYFNACEQAHERGKRFNEPTLELNLTLGGHQQLFSG